MTEVNSQITDAVTQTNVKVVAEAPAQAIASLYQVASSAAGLSLQNAVDSQVDGLAVTLLQPDAMKASVEAAVNANIPVVAFNAVQ